MRPDSVTGNDRVAVGQTLTTAGIFDQGFGQVVIGNLPRYLDLCVHLD